MYTQNTPVHVKLWHKDFWILATANMFIAMFAYMQLVMLPEWMSTTLQFTDMEIAAAMGIHGAGPFLVGCFCTFLIWLALALSLCCAILVEAYRWRCFRHGGNGVVEHAHY